MIFRHNIPLVPYFIFLKGLQDKSDTFIMDLLELGPGISIETTKDTSWQKDALHVYRKRDWVHLMDNWWYTFWHSEALSKRVEVVGEMLEIFVCSRGDADESFDFKYFKEGKKIREYVVESPNYSDEIVKIDWGNPLPGEAEGLKQKDQLHRITHIAKSLGIRFPSALSEIQSYQMTRWSR